MNTEKKILIVSILAIILSLISVAFSIYSYLINNKEIISMSVDLVETNYETLILPINNPLFQSLEQSEDSMNIMIQYYVETINNSINPITINAVYSVPESDFIEESNLLFFNLKRWFKRHESKYSNQISELKKFEPGSSYKFEIVYSHILNKFYYKLLLKDVLPKLSENHGGFHSFYNGF